MLCSYMVLGAAKIIKFLLFVTMLVLGATSVPQILFLLFLQNDISDMPKGAILDIVVHFIVFIVVVFGFIGISIWVRKQNEVF